MNKQEQKDRAWQEYQAIKEPAREKYKAIYEQADKEYEAITEPARKKYYAKCRAIDEQDKDIKIIDGKKYKLID